MPSHHRRHTPRTHRPKRRHHTKRRHRHHRRYKDRVYFDMLKPSSFSPTTLCSPLGGSTYRSRSAKTPRYHAKHCTGKVRLGRDSRTLYVSVMRRKRVAYSRMYHTSYYWKVVYDRMTNKKFDVSLLPRWVLVQIS